MTRRIGIIGAGPGGLACAMLLARAGAEVTVFERQPHVGGRSATITARAEPGTFRFDMGPTFFLYPRVLEDVFAACGRRLRDEVDLIRLEPQYELAYADGTRLAATADRARLAAEIAKLCPADAPNVARYMADNRAKLAAFRPVLERPFGGLSAFLDRDVLAALPKLWPPRSVDADLGRYFSDPRVRLAFSFQSKYLGMSPFRCPSLFSILAFMEYEYGVWHPRGGCGAVMTAMARVATEMGVDIRLAEPVRGLTFQGRRATGVRTDAGEERFDALVVNADFAHAMRTLVPDALRRRWTDRRIARKKFSCSTFMLYLGLEGRYDDVAHHTIHLAEDYRRNVAEIEAAGAPPEEPSFYVQNASVTDDSLAPPGHSTLYVLVPVGHRREGGPDWDAIAPRYRRLALDRLEQIGVTGIEKRIRYEKMLTPADWEGEMAIHQGATFNLAHNIGQMLHWRPRNRFEDIDGMYLVGGGTHPGSGLPVIFESARISARLLAEDLDLGGAWDEPAPSRIPALEPAVAEAL
jgi:phytoene desaturase